jgi:hypothetical protein
MPTTDLWNGSYDDAGCGCELWVYNVSTSTWGSYVDAGPTNNNGAALMPNGQVKFTATGYVPIGSAVKLRV